MKKIIIYLIMLLILLISCGNNNNCESNSSTNNDTISTNSNTYFSTNNSTLIQESTSENLDNEDNFTYNNLLKIAIDDKYQKNESFINYIFNDQEYIDNTTISPNSIFVTNNGNGMGRLNDPTSIYDALYNSKPGDVIYLREGIYELTEPIYINRSGNLNQYITIRNYPGEDVYITSNETNINKYSDDGQYNLFVFEEDVSYIKIEGLNIGNISSKYSTGIVFYGGGQNNIIIRNNEIHSLKTNSTKEDDYDSGANSILLLGEGIKPIHSVLIYKNYCHDNVTGWSETISVAGNAEGIYIINNIVENNTNIGIDFYGNAGYCTKEELDQPRYCVAAFNKVSGSICKYADSAGIYVDGARDVLITNNEVTKSQFGIEIGSEEKNNNYHVKNIIVRNNIIHDNLVCGLRIGGYDEITSGYVKNTIIINNTIVNNSNHEIMISMVENVEFINNLILSNETNSRLVATDFTREYVKNITFKNNYFNNSNYELLFELYEEKQTNIDSFNKIIGGNNITGLIEITSDFKVTNGITINNGYESIHSGDYDYYLNKRIQNKKIDIGACEN